RTPRRKSLSARALLLQRSVRSLLRRQHDVERRLRSERHDVRSGREEILDEIEAALALAVVFEVEVPVGRGLESRSFDRDLHVRGRYAVASNQRMRVAAGKQRAESELYGICSE